MDRSSLNFVPTGDALHDRWHRVFAERIQLSPWMPPRTSGNALLLGQGPGDFGVLNTELKYGSLEKAYR